MKKGATTRRELSIYAGRDRMGSVVIVGNGDRATYSAIDIDNINLGIFPSQVDATREILASWLARQKTSLTQAEPMRNGQRR